MHMAACALGQRFQLDGKVPCGEVGKVIWHRLARLGRSVNGCDGRTCHRQSGAPSFSFTNRSKTSRGKGKLSLKGARCVLQLPRTHGQSAKTVNRSGTKLGTDAKFRGMPDRCSNILTAFSRMAPHLKNLAALPTSSIVQRLLT